MDLSSQMNCSLFTIRNSLWRIGITKLDYFLETFQTFNQKNYIPDLWCPQGAKIFGKICRDFFRKENAKHVLDEINWLGK